MKPKPVKDSEVSVPRIPTTKIAREKERWFERANESLSEWCSPILVKETRQALKSKQFLYTYFLLLLVVAVWVIFGIGWNQWTGNYDSQPNGRDLIYGLFVIIAVPLGIVIPFTAYRSLAKEYEDGTIQLISISTMKPYQIVLGKFGSAFLQMLVYLSVMAPCILLGYLLRGVSLAQIMWALAFVVWGSLFLTILGLFLGGLIKGRGMNSIVSVIFVLLLAWINWGWFWIVNEMIYRSTVQGREWPLVVSMFFIHSSAFAILLLVAAATQISFRSDNHATPVRIAMMIHQALFMGTAVMLLNLVGDFDYHVVGAFNMFAAHYWALMGFLIVGEAANHSRRILRSLPRSIFGRTFGSLLMPGPGRGFLFVVSMLWSCGLAITLIGQFQEYLMFFPAPLFGPRFVPTFIGWNQIQQIYGITFVTCLYPTLFLALIYLAASWRLHRNKTRGVGVGPVISLIAGILMFVVVSVCSMIVHSQFGTEGLSDSGQFSSFFNWYWIFANFMTTGSVHSNWYLMFAFPACLIIFAAFVIASKELLQTPVAIPERVLEDSQPLKPELPPGESIDEIFA